MTRFRRDRREAVFLFVVLRSATGVSVRAPPPRIQCDAGRTAILALGANYRSSKDGTFKDK